MLASLLLSKESIKLMKGELEDQTQRNRKAAGRQPDLSLSFSPFHSFFRKNERLSTDYQLIFMCMCACVRLCM